MQQHQHSIRKSEKDRFDRVERYVSVRGYSLTDFKESAFFANKCFGQTGEKKQAVPNISTNKLHLPAVARSGSGKLLRSLE
jgi:hypothetical protein